MTRFIDRRLVADITIYMNGQSQEISADVLDDLKSTYNIDYDCYVVDDVAAVIRAAYARVSTNESIDVDVQPIIKSMYRGQWDDDLGEVSISANIKDLEIQPKIDRYNDWIIWVQCDKDSDNGAPFFDRANPDCKVTLVGVNGHDWDVKEDILPVPDWIIWDIINTMVPAKHDFY